MKNDLKIGDRFYSVGNFYVTLSEITDTDYVFTCDNGNPWGGPKKDIEKLILDGILKRVNDDICEVQEYESVNSNEKTVEIPFKRYKELLKVEAKFLQLKKILESMKEREA